MHTLPRIGKLAAGVFLCIAILSCRDYPKDPGGTFNRVKRESVVRIGVISEEPWAKRLPDGSAEGIEGELAAGFAESLGAKPVWHFLSEKKVVEGLENGGLDLGIGGFTDDSPRKKKLGFTRPYVETPKKGGGKESHVLAVPRGENRWLTELEKYLSKHRQQAAAALPHATPAPQ